MSNPEHRKRLEYINSLQSMVDQSGLGSAPNGTTTALLGRAVPPDDAPAAPATNANDVWKQVNAGANAVWQQHAAQQEQQLAAKQQELQPAPPAPLTNPVGQAEVTVRLLELAQQVQPCSQTCAETGVDVDVHAHMHAGARIGMRTDVCGGMCMRVDVCICTWHA